MGFIRTLKRVMNGLSANDGTGDSLRSGAAAINLSWDAIEGAVNALATSQGSGVKPYATYAALLADPQPDGVMAVVYADPEPTRNTSYARTEGAWIAAYDRLTFALGNGSGVQQEGLGAWIRAVQDKCRDQVSVMDYMSPSERADARSGKPVMDHSASVQKAFDFAAQSDADVLFPRGTYNVANVRLTNKTVAGRPWHVRGHGATLVNPAETSSTTPCLYTTTLSAPGAKARQYDYSGGIYLWGINFVGKRGFGIGFKVAIMGQFHDVGCTYANLEEGIRSLGCSGFHKTDGKFNGCGYGINFEQLANDPHTANYKAEGTGWNDGVNIRSCSIGTVTQGIRYTGSTSEGIVRVDSVIFTACTDAFIDAQTFQSFVIENCWTEYVNTPTADMFRFHRDAASFEAVGAVVIKNCHFFNNGVFRYLVFCETRRLRIEKCYVQMANAAIYTGGVWFNSGTSNAWGVAATLTPAGTGIYTSSGIITLREADIAAMGNVGGGQYVHLYATIDGVKYFLKWRSRASDGAGGYNASYDVRKYLPVYASQFPQVGENWLNTTDVTNRTAVEGITIDPANVKGLTFTGPTITASPATWGPLDNNGGICELHDILVSNMSLERFYQQREFGKVSVRNVRKQ